MEQNGESLYEKILDKLDLLEEAIVQFENDHLNVFNTLICQLASMGVNIEDEDKAVTLLCSLPDSQNHLVTSISFSTTDTLEFDSIVGSLLAEEVKSKSNIETST